MTLRGRLTTAFLAVVLGPVLLGAFFVGGAVSAVTAERSTERLDRAATAVATSVGALCEQLHAAAAAVAVTEPARRPVLAGQLVGDGLASAVAIFDSAGRTTFTTRGAPPAPWVDCADPAPRIQRYGAISARVELRDARGLPRGAVLVARALDQGFVDRLAEASGAAVTLLGGATVTVHSTEATGTVDAIVREAAGLTTERATSTPDGTRYVRRLGPAPGQPLPIVLSIPRSDLHPLYAVLVAAVVLAGLVAVGVAWWLARSTTRPITELARAADRVAGGDLAARVPVRGRDEVGRLGTAFNRMTRETQAYVQALTASRDQLRGHLAILGDTLSSTHDLGRILQVILQTAVAATGARAGAVLLLDPETRMLVGQCTEGLDEQWPEPVDEPAAEAAPAADAAPAGGPPVAAVAAAIQAAAAGQMLPDDSDTIPLLDRRRDPATLRVPLGSGVLGGVAATGIPQRGHVGRDGPGLSPYEPRCRTYVAVPFSVPGPREPGGDPAVTSDGALGVLALYDRLGSDEFDDRDLTTLRTFAGQAAVAVDNVLVHREAQRLSLTDPLTGLWNYRYLQVSVRREVERASRFGRMLTVLAMDLDRFKEVNDTYGHAGGDAVLTEFARRLRAEVREVDLAFRQGGEEFVVLLPETSAAGGAVVAERLGAAVRRTPVPVHRDTGAPALVTITVSIGIAVYPDHATTAQQVLDAADEALYAAKAAGRDTYRVASVTAPPPAEEIAVPPAAASPPDDLPRAGGPEPGAGPGSDPARSTVITEGGGAPDGPHPPRQSRGR